MDLQTRSATPNSVYDVECDGGEEMLLQCSYQPGPPDTSCHDAGVVCQGMYTYVHACIHLYVHRYIHMYMYICMHVQLHVYIVT